MKKYLGLSVGIGACSMASHCMAYGVLGSRISEGGVRTWLAVLAVGRQAAPCPSHRDIHLGWIWSCDSVLV